MSDISRSTLSDESRVLLFSQRNIFSRDLFRCPLFEFEDVITEIDAVDIVAPHADLRSRRYGLANRLAFHGPITLKANLERIQPAKQYDIFFAVCGSARDLLMVESAKYLRKNCRMSVLLLDEIWVKQMDYYRHFLRVLEGFDLVVLYYSQSVEAMHKRTGSRCVFVPPGVDAIRFCPYPNGPDRVVDVYSVGRRSKTTHQALLKMGDDSGIFYLHDSIAGLEAISADEHRRLFSNIAKRTKYFIVNPGLIDVPERRGNQLEIGNRYFEGAAAGTIMVGEIPHNGEFEKLFDWQDAVIHLPYDSNKINEIVRELERQPERQETIRRNNVVHALRRHDWVYRWESILRHLGVKPKSALNLRKQCLNSLADAVSAHGASLEYASQTADAAGCPPEAVGA
jgi:hypothetical protein